GEGDVARGGGGRGRAGRELGIAGPGGRGDGAWAARGGAPVEESAGRARSTFGFDRLGFDRLGFDADGAEKVRGARGGRRRRGLDGHDGAEGDREEGADGRGGDRGGSRGGVERWGGLGGGAESEGRRCFGGEAGG